MTPLKTTMIVAGLLAIAGLPTVNAADPGVTVPGPVFATTFAQAFVGAVCTPVAPPAAPTGACAGLAAGVTTFQGGVNTAATNFQATVSTAATTFQGVAADAPAAISVATVGDCAALAPEEAVACTARGPIDEANTLLAAAISPTGLAPTVQQAGIALKDGVRDAATGVKGNVVTAEGAIASAAVVAANAYVGYANGLVLTKTTEVRAIEIAGKASANTNAGYVGLFIKGFAGFCGTGGLVQQADDQCSAFSGALSTAADTFTGQVGTVATTVPTVAPTGLPCQPSFSTSPGANGLLVPNAPTGCPAGP